MNYISHCFLSAFFESSAIKNILKEIAPSFVGEKIVIDFDANGDVNTITMPIDGDDLFDEGYIEVLVEGPSMRAIESLPYFSGWI